MLVRDDITKLANMISEQGSWYFEYDPDRRIPYEIYNQDGLWMHEKETLAETLMIVLFWVFKSHELDQQEVQKVYKQLGTVLGV